MSRHLLLLLIMLTAAAVPAEAGFYRWTDAEGREFYTNELEKVPSEFRATARPVEVRDDRVSTAPAQGAPARNGTVTVQPHRDRNGQGEAYWKKRADGLRQKIRKRNAEREGLVKRGQEAARRRPVPTKADRNAEKDRERKLAKIDQDIKRLRHELDVELPDEARKADALPGWLR